MTPPKFTLVQSKVRDGRFRSGPFNQACCLSGGTFGQLTKIFNAVGITYI